MELSLTDEVLLLRAQVDFLLERATDTQGMTQRPVDWTALDADAAAQHWQHLTSWVDWLREHYQLREAVPACWYAHPPLLEELSALQASWHGAYLDPDARAGDGSAWHDLLERTLQRLRGWDRTGCADGTHRPDLPNSDDTDHPHRDHHIHFDLQRRQPRPIGEQP